MKVVLLTVYLVNLISVTSSQQQPTNMLQPRSMATNMLKLVFSGSKVERQPYNEQPEERQPVNLLETISLSYAGNFDLANTIRQGGNIARNVARALGSLLDLKMVRSMVEATLGSFLPDDEENEISRSRSGLEGMDNEVDNSELAYAEDIKEAVTMVVGAVIGQQECWQKIACKVGSYGRWIPGKDFLLIVLGRVLPQSWESGLEAAAASATYSQDCGFYECSTDPEGTETDA